MRGASILCGFFGPEPRHTVQESGLLTQRAIMGAWRAGRDAKTSGLDSLKALALAEAACGAVASGRAVAPLELKLS